MRIGFIGAGRIGSALIRGAISADVVQPDEIMVSDVDSDRLRSLRDTLSVNTVSDNPLVFEGSDVVVLAVKPQNMADVLGEVSGSVRKDQLVVSIAAGISTGFIEQHLFDRVRVIRVMPNAACIVGEAASAFSAGKNATDEDREAVKKIFGAVGHVYEVDETLMNAVTGLSGSGPAFISLVIGAMAEAGVMEGMDEDTARKLAAQTALGAAKILLEKGMDADELIKMVSSPGGTTVEGLKTMRSQGVKEAVIAAVRDATRRSAELEHKP